MYEYVWMYGLGVQVYILARHGLVVSGIQLTDATGIKL